MDLSGKVFPTTSAFEVLLQNLLMGRGYFRWMVCGRGKQIASLVIRGSSFVSLPRGQPDRESCKNEGAKSSVTLGRQTRTRLGTIRPVAQAMLGNEEDSRICQDETILEAPVERYCWSWKCCVVMATNGALMESVIV